MTKTILSAILMTAALALSLPAIAHDVHEPSIRTFPVTANAQIKVTPDQAKIMAGVITEGREASEVVSENAAKMTALYETLRLQGVGRNDIATSQLSLTPRYDYENRKKPRIVAYEAKNIVTITTLDLTKIGPIIDSIVQAGSNNVQNVQFSIRDTEALEAKVLDKAIRKARAKAQRMATSAGVTLGPLQNMNVSGGQYQPFNRVYDEIIVTSTGGGGGVPSTPVSYSDQTVTATVSLVYEMR